MKRLSNHKAPSILMHLALCTAMLAQTPMLALADAGDPAPATTQPTAADKAPAIDLHDASPYCKAAAPLSSPLMLRVLEKKQSVATPGDEPADLMRITNSATEQKGLSESWSLSYQMNEVYLKNIAKSLPNRIALAEHLGIDISPLAKMRQSAHDACGTPDGTGQNHQLAFQLIERALDVKSERLSNAEVDAYVTNLTIALLEYSRLETVFRASAKRVRVMAGDDPARKIVSDGAKEALMRLLILRERFPILQNTGWSEKSGRMMVTLVENSILSKWGGLATNEAYYGDPSLDAMLGYVAIHHDDGTPSGEARIEALGFMSASLPRDQMLYPKLYRSFLGGARLPSGMKSTIIKAVAFSLEQSLRSAEMKCEASTCNTFSLQPNLTASVAASHGMMDSIRPEACACRIGHEQTTVDTTYNIAAAVAGSSLTLFCILQPEYASVCYAALASTLVDVGAGVAGIYDAQVNRAAFMEESSGQAGDAVDPITSYKGETESKRVQFNFLFNWVTGLISFTPYRIASTTSYRLAQIPLALMTNHAVQETTVIESVKAATALPPPELYIDASETIQPSK